MRSFSHDGENFGRDSNRVLPEYVFKYSSFVIILSYPLQLYTTSTADTASYKENLYKAMNNDEI